MRASWMRVGAVALAALLAAQAFGEKKAVPGLEEAVAPVWSLSASQDEMTVAVSPARRTMQLVGSSGALIGASVAAVANDRYRREIREVLVGYDAGAVFEERLEARLTAALGEKLTQTGPMTSTAGYDSKSDAAAVRYASLGKHGADMLLELEMTYGLFGPGGTLVTKLDGQLVSTPRGKELWENVVVVNSEPILAGQKLADPTKQLAPDFSSLRLSAEDDAITQWTKDGGERLKRGFEAAVDAVVSALLCDLGLAEEAAGEYQLGKLALNRKKFEEAHAHFQKALSLDPAMTDAANGQAVALASNKQLDEAIQCAERCAAAAPDYAPAWYNLAWWYAIEKKDAAKARPCYEKALALGLAANEKIEKVLAKKS